MHYQGSICTEKYPPPPPGGISANAIWGKHLKKRRERGKYKRKTKKGERK
jgi:hypothetical protein